MTAFRSGTVVEIIAQRPGLQRVRVESDAGAERAYVLTQLIGEVALGDDVVFNTTAVDLDLGTGGWHFVHWNLTRSSWSEPGPGHIMKLRYTSLQSDTGAVEEHADPGTDLGGIPVVACTLHSQVPIVAATYLAERPSSRVVYVMTDGAALPIALSDMVVAMAERGMIAATVTAGHAFGGDHEAVSMPSGLAIAAAVADADLIIAGMGPGVVGTNSSLGTTSVEAAWILDTTAALGGVPIACVRASGADGRERHRGASHHTSTVLSLTRTAVDVPTVAGALPELLDGGAAHRIVKIADGADPIATLSAHDLRVTSMGRGPDDDPLFYAAAGAAGTFAARVPNPE